MATFLRTRKMSPALAARVEASVRGAQAIGQNALAPRLIATFRLALLFAIVSLAAWLVSWRQGSKERLEQDREGLLQEVRRHSSVLTLGEKGLIDKLQWRFHLGAGAYGGDQVTDAVRSAATFSAAMKRSLVFIRAPLDAFARPEHLAESASSGSGDAFLLCLLSPPTTRDEKALLARTRDALAGGKRASAAAHVERLQYALIGMPLLLPSWETRVLRAETSLEIDKLRRTFARAPIEHAQRAAKADLLLTVMDEPRDKPGPTELDGECPHYVRVELIDLKTEQVLLRLRRYVDPGWISPATRAEYASGMDGCALALDVREAVSASAIAAAPN